MSVVDSEVKTAVAGATPRGATDTASAARAVRGMFTAIAPRYDLANHLLSFNIDRFWWCRAARTFREILAQPDTRVLDLCCGTGDMTFALQMQAGDSNGLILGADFSHAMLERARQKSFPLKASPEWIEADALNLPFPDSHFDLVTSAFGFRNLADYDAGLREIARVLRPGGECGILDFGVPGGIVGRAYRLYFKTILPWLGTMISGVRGPYEYLPASVERFPGPEEMLRRMGKAGFIEASWEPYTLGVAGLYRAKKV
ncbi:MAG TPA: bifunctional demethylmenaquinone methyltransferase/2-methoxy-6-polyprenyl-1,4-benzoquinol methylase UbiE [Candidatus Sulfotelmatobacter sp.]